MDTATDVDWDIADLIACIEVAKYQLAEFYARGYFENTFYIDFCAELEVVREKLSYGSISTDLLEKIGCEYLELVLKILTIVSCNEVDIHKGISQ